MCWNTVYWKSAEPWKKWEDLAILNLHLSPQADNVQSTMLALKRHPCFGDWEVTNQPTNAGDTGEFDPWARKIPWRREWQTPPPASILAWKIPWTKEPGGLQSMGSQRIGHGWVTEHTQCFCLPTSPYCSFLKAKYHCTNRDTVKSLLSASIPQPNSSPLL